MEWTGLQVLMIVVMTATGTLNALCQGLGSKQKSMGTLRIHSFDHIFLWVEGMFLGEFICLPVYVIVQWYMRRHGNIYQGGARFNPLLFLPAALMDMGSTIMLYVGTHMTFKYHLQLFRGTSVIFSAFLSTALLRFTITKTMWVGITITTTGLAVIGVIDGVFHPGITAKSANWNIAGALFIIVGEFVYTVQINYMEKFIKQFDISPLEARGLEGVFGTLVLGILLVPFYYINGGSFFVSNPYRSVEDVGEAFEQMHNNYVILISYLGYVFSKALYNYSEMRLVKEQGATTTIILNTLKIIPTWLMFMAIGWTNFIAYEVIGYLLQIVGICVYCGVLFVPALRWYIRHILASRPSNSLTTQGHVSSSNSWSGESGESTPILGQPHDSMPKC